MKVTLELVHSSEPQEHDATATRVRDHVYFVYVGKTTYIYPLVNIIKIIEEQVIPHNQ
jgi:hypothetical protein